MASTGWRGPEGQGCGQEACWERSRALTIPEMSFNGMTLSIPLETKNQRPAAEPWPWQV